MTPFETIRQLINLDSYEPDLFDEIDARSTAYLRDLPYRRHDREPDTDALRVWTGSGEPILCPAYHASRDALMAARPRDWWFRELYPQRFAASPRDIDDGVVDSVILADTAATAELSELMCILMVIEMQRTGQTQPVVKEYATGPETFTTTLYHPEAATVAMIAARAGVKAHRVVECLLRTPTFMEAVEAATGEETTIYPDSIQGGPAEIVAERDRLFDTLIETCGMRLGEVLPDAPGTRFTIELNADQARTVRLLAERAGLSPQEIVQGLASSPPFSGVVALTTGEWTTTYPESEKGMLSDMTATRDQWFDAVLFDLGLLKGEALQEFCRQTGLADDKA